MQQITDRTTKIYFGNDAIKVKETLAEILMLDALNPQPHVLTATLHAEPVAIVLVEPVGAVGNDGGFGGEAESKRLKHAPNIGVRRVFESARNRQWAGAVAST
jgi:hypothetical protein